MTMWKTGTIVAGVVFALLAGTPKAPAAVTVLTSATPETIPVGGTVQLDFQLSLSPDPGFTSAAFVGGAIELFSGDGQHKTFLFGPGGTSRDFIWDVVYNSVGNFIPSYTGLVSYLDTGSHQVCGPRRCFTVPDIALKFQGLSGDFQDPGVG